MVIKILVLFGTMFLIMMIGSPIAVALGVATMVTMTATTNISLTTMSTACDGDPVFYAGWQSDEIRRHIPEDPGFC